MSAAVLEADAGISRCPKVGRSTETDIRKFVQPRVRRNKRAQDCILNLLASLGKELVLGFLFAERLTGCGFILHLLCRFII